MLRRKLHSEKIGCVLDAIDDIGVFKDDDEIDEIWTWENAGKSMRKKWAKIILRVIIVKMHLINCWKVRLCDVELFFKILWELGERGRVLNEMDSNEKYVRFTYPFYLKTDLWCHIWSHSQIKVRGNFAKKREIKRLKIEQFDSNVLFKNDFRD